MKFEKKELDNTKVILPTPENPRGFNIIYDSPITTRENFRRALRGEAEWIPAGYEAGWFCPEIIPDNPARAFVIEYQPFKGTPGGKDMFGIDWEYVPSAKGSIVRPGNPTLTDITKWKEVIQFPDIDTWDWEGSAEKNRAFLKNSPKYLNLCIFTGFFERLISFMDFGPAAFALMNKKTQPYVNELFEKLTDLWIDIVDHADKYYQHGFDGFCFHDDWGAQHSPFFNARVVRQMLVPHMKRLTDHIHKLGYKADLHSCGKLVNLISCIEEAGWDSWEGMVINDFHEAYNIFTTKLIMKIDCKDNLKDLSDEEMTETVKRFLDEFGNRERPFILANRYPTDPRFFLEVYKQSRIKFGE